MSAKITIIVPVHNVTNYIEQCIQSLINQTMKEIEVVVVDDCSTDDSIKKVKSIARRDSRIHIISNSINLGPGESRNIGLSLVSTPYVAFLDSDDFVAPDFYEKLYQAAINSGADIAIGNTRYYYEETNTCEDGWCGQYNFWTDSKIVETPEDKQYNIYACACWDKIYRTELFTKYKIAFPQKLYIEDVPVTFLTVSLANKLALVRNAHIYYRQRTTSIMKSLQANKRVFDVFAIYDYAEKSLGQAFPDENGRVYKKILDNFKIFNIYEWSKFLSGKLREQFNIQMKEEFSRIEISNNPFITSQSRDIYRKVTSEDFVFGTSQYYLFGFIPLFKMIRTSRRTYCKLFNKLPLFTRDSKISVTRYFLSGIPVLKRKDTHR